MRWDQAGNRLATILRHGRRETDTGIKSALRDSAGESFFMQPYGEAFNRNADGN